MEPLQGSITFYRELSHIYSSLSWRESVNINMHRQYMMSLSRTVPFVVIC